MSNDSDNPRHLLRLRWALAIVLCAVAAVAVWQRMRNRPDEQASAYAVHPETLRSMVCDHCGATMKMTASEFDRARRNVHPETHMLTCPECKEPRLWRAPSSRAFGSFKPSSEQINGAIDQGDDEYAPMKPNVGVDRKRKTPPR